MTAPSKSRNLRLSALLSGPAPVIAFLICFFALGLSAASRKSVTGDEGFHLISGLSYWVFNDYHLASDTLPWAQRWIALPIWISSYQFPPFQSTQWQHTSQGKLGMQLLYESGNDPDRMLILARIMNGFLGLCIGTYYLSLVAPLVRSHSAVLLASRYMHFLP